MRALFIVLSLCIAAMVYAQSNPPAPTPAELGKGKQGKTSASNKNPKANQQQPEKQSVFVEIAPGQVAQVSAAIEASKSNEKPLSEWIVLIIQALAAIFVAAFTGALWWSTKKLWRATEESIEVARISAQAARDAADAAVNSAAPFLALVLRGFRLYPIDREVSDTDVHTPTISVTLENVGRTPAMLRRVGAKLLLIEGDRMPAVPPVIADIPSVERSDTIASGGAASVKRFGFERQIGAAEIRGLRARAIKRHQYFRFHVVGFAIYDDVFGVRHTQRFCMKVRQEGEFQRQRGGDSYNNVERQKVSKTEPEESAPDGDPPT